MSFYTITLNFLGINPKIWIAGDELHSRTPLFLQILNLFSYSRHITVDKKSRLIRIVSRWLWGLKKDKTIPFERIDYIDTNFKSFGSEWGWGGRRDQFETYSILLVLKNPPMKYSLIKFRGEGSTAHTGHSGFLIRGDKLIDFSGNQKQVFQQYLELLKKFTGASLMPSLSKEFQERHVYCCKGCGRKSWQDQTCMYCGGEVALMSKAESAHHDNKDVGSDGH